MPYFPMDVLLARIKDRARSLRGPDGASKDGEPSTTPATSVPEQRADQGAERLHLVEELVEGAVAEADLEVAHTHGAELAQAGGQLLGRSRERVAADVPARVAHVEHLGDGAEVDGLVADRALPVLEEIGDLFGHLGARRALWQPAVALLGSPAQRRPRRSAHPD